MGGFDVNHARATLLSLGAVNINGTPVNAQVALWFDLDTIEGSANLTFDGSILLLAGNLSVSGVGPHAISGAPFGAVQLIIGDTFISDGSSVLTASFYHTPAVVGAAGTTLSLSGAVFTAGLTTQTATESIADVAQIIINEPFITDNLTGGGLITRASTVIITGAPTEGVDNYALRVAAGLTSLVGELELGTSPSAAGTLRIPNTGSITMRNMGNDGDLNVISSALSDNLDIGDTVNPACRIFSDRVDMFNLRVIGSATGDITRITRLSSTRTTPSGATATFTNLIPAGSLVLAVTARVITAVTGPTGFDIGDGVDVDRWGNSIPVALGTVTSGASFTSNTVQLFPTANDVVITSDGVDFTGGEIRVTVHFMDFTGPTS